MPTIYRLIAATVLVMLVGIAPASAWRSYAECGLNESQVMTASSGKAVPCRQDAPVYGGRHWEPLIMLASVTCATLAEEIRNQAMRSRYCAAGSRDRPASNQPDKLNAAAAGRSIDRPMGRRRPALRQSTGSYTGPGSPGIPWCPVIWSIRIRKYTGFRGRSLPFITVLE